MYFKTRLRSKSGLSIKMFHTDRGDRFFSKEFNLFCEENGIHRELQHLILRSKMVLVSEKIALLWIWQEECYKQRESGINFGLKL